jgi:hypothetical protein
MEFDIHEDVSITSWIFCILMEISQTRYRGDRGVFKESTPDKIGTADSLMNEDWIGDVLNAIPAQGGENICDPRVDFKVIKSNHFPSKFFNDNTPHYLYSPKLVATSMT